MVIVKSVGLVFGVIGFLELPNFLENVSITFRLAVLFWPITIAGVIGLSGFITKCAIINKCPLKKAPLWRAFFRGGFVGAWMNFVLGLVLYEFILNLYQFFPFELPNPLILMSIKGFLFGALVDVLATKYGGDGKALL
jgi:hypothetical protein